ncbi:MAG TPA: HAD-IB family phosphatase [Gemmatimonadaceae bacterium]|jgi:phosphoserine phosphatase|nr:HAD-IB family phosphatase [Gemmatimonadaceae bacterium]
MPPFRSVIFDCDSTLTRIEGIDVLAGSLREESERLTEQAMRGTLRLEEIYGRRLALIAPTRDQVNAVGERYVAEMVPDAAGVVAALQGEGIDVRILSGGLLPAVLTLARALGVPEWLVGAVNIFFNADGSYAGFDTASPMARSGGKLEMVTRWGPSLRRPVMMVGDGATDLETRPGVDLMVAFAGVVARPAVVAGADVVVTSTSLAPILPLALDHEAPRAGIARALYEQGAARLAAQSTERQS